MSVRDKAMTKKPDFTIVIPPNTLRMKAERPGGVTRTQAAESARAVIARSAKEYRRISLQDVDELDALVPSLFAQDGTATPSRQTVYKKAHQLWALGDTFDYPLVTSIADSLCFYLGKLGETGAIERSIILLHLQSLRLIIGQGIQGDGGPAEQQMVAGLRQATAKALVHAAG